MTLLVVNLFEVARRKTAWPAGVLDRFKKVKSVSIIARNDFADRSIPNDVGALLDFPSVQSALAAIAAVPGLTTLILSLESYDETGDHYITITNRIRPLMLQITKDCDADLLINVAQNVETQGVSFHLHPRDTGGVYLVTELSKRRFLYVDLYLPQYKPEVRRLIHPDLLGFGLHVRGGMITRYGSNLDALARSLRGAPKLRELRLIWPTADSRTIDCMEIATTVAGLQLEVARFEPFGTVLWHANSILLLNAILRSERIRNAWTIGHVPERLLGFWPGELEYTVALKQARNLYSIVNASGRLAPEMMLTITMTTYTTKESLLIALNLLLSDVVAFARKREAERGDLYFESPYVRDSESSEYSD